MTADPRYSNKPLEFWANVKLISQRVGYTERGTSRIKVPNQHEIEVAFNGLGLDTSRLTIENKPTIFGEDLLLTEALFGKEVVERIPLIVQEWVDELNK